MNRDAAPAGPRPDLVPTLAAVQGLFAAAACSCAVVGEAGESLVFVAAVGEGSAQVVGVELPVGRGVAGWSVMSGQPIAIRDVRADARFARDVAESTDYVPTSLLAAPLFDRDGEVAGVVEVLDPAADWAPAVLGALAVPLAQLLVSDRPAAEDRLARLGREVLAAVDAHRPARRG